MATEAPGDTPGGGSEHDWLFDYIMNVFKAPTWEVPVMSFIDDNCVVFDNEEENKFAYSELHEVRTHQTDHALLDCGLTRLLLPGVPVFGARRSSSRWWKACWRRT